MRKFNRDSVDLLFPVHGLHRQVASKVRVMKASAFLEIIIPHTPCVHGLLTSFIM